MKNRRTWILLRGLAREKGHWGAFTEQMAARFPDDEILPLDLPGAGEFRDVTAPRTMNQIYEFVRARAVERAKMQNSFSLIAISLGGMVALEWMRQKPEDLAECVLINTSSKALSPFFERLRWQVWKSVVSILMTGTPRERESKLVDLLINSAEARNKALPLWIRLATEHPIRYKNVIHQLMAAAQFNDLPPENCATPTLVLCGLGDRFVDPSCSLALAEKMNWPVKRHPWGGHDLTWDDPDWVISQIQAWLESADRIA